MKIQFTILFIAATFSGLAQFTLNHSDTILETGQHTPLFVCLDGHGIKRIKFSEADQKLYIYHLDNTLFRELLIPTVPWTPVLNGQIEYVSTALFDLDTSTIEFSIYTTSPSRHRRVYREDGTLLADFPNRGSTYIQGFGSFTSPQQYSYPVISTDSGTIMRLTLYNGNVPLRNEFYTLPGKLPNCSVNNGNEVTGISGTPLRPAGDLIFPNPVYSGQKVTYRMGQDYAHGKLMFFDNSGKKVHHVTLTDPETDIFLERTIFPAGTYYYQFYSDNEAVGAKQLIVIN